MLRATGIACHGVAIPWPTATIIVILGAQAAMFIGYSIAVLAGYRPAPADPWIFPVVPQFMALAYALAVVRMFGRSERFGLNPPAADL